MTEVARGPAPRLYAEIEAALREDILSGRQAVGSCLPGA